MPIEEMVGLADQWNGSPKTSNSQNEQKGVHLEKLYGKSLPFYEGLQNISFKFAIDNTEDLVEMHKVIKNTLYQKKKSF